MKNMTLHNMKNYLILALSTVVLHGAAFSACHVYSLPSRCSVAFSDEPDPICFDHAEIVATEDADGHAVSPFRISGYDKDGKLIYNTVFSARNAGEDGIREVLLADFSDEVVVHRNIVQDELRFGDDHFRISGMKTGGEFLVMVEKLDLLRIEAAIEAQIASIRSDELMEPSMKWAAMDGIRRYRCSCERRSIALPIGDGESSDAGGLSVRGALYQRENEVSVRFELFREKAGAERETIAEGRAIFEITEDGIKNSVVTYDTGEGVVKVDVSLANRNEWLIKQPGNEELDAALKRFGIKERTVRLSIAYGTTLTSLYLGAQAQ